MRDYELQRNCWFVMFKGEMIERTGQEFIKATEIVDMVDNDALCCVVDHTSTLRSIKPAVECFGGTSYSKSDFIKTRYMDLPMGIEWLEHLDALGAIRLSSGITTLKKFSEYYPGVLTGYACVGIKKGSEEHKKAVELLSTVNIGLSGLADNCFWMDMSV